MKYILGLVATIFIMACNSSEKPDSGNVPDGKCQTAPAAIFSDTMRVVKKHSFEVDGQSSIEESILTNNLKFEILQSGCQALRQEFRITRKGDYLKMDDGFWISGAFQTLGVLSNSSPKLMGLELYADIIAQNAADAKLGKPFFPDPTISVTLDKIVNEEEGSIIVIFQEIIPETK